MGFLVLALIIPEYVFSQSFEISGTVTDENNETLIGVNVIEVGTTNGTVTDVNGRYNLVVSPNSSITFSYIGFKTKPLKLATRESLMW